MTEATFFLERRRPALPLAAAGGHAGATHYQTEPNHEHHEKTREYPQLFTERLTILSCRSLAD